MKRVLASGVFDLLHPGHEYYLEKAADLGDHLTVIVTSDSHAERTKRQPLNSAELRAREIKKLRMVDRVLVGFEPYDLVAMVREAKPDVIALGHDQDFDEGKLRGELAEHNIIVEIVRLEPHPEPHATSQMLRDGQTSA